LEAVYSFTSVQKALDLGINFFDTAQAYGFGLAERMLGEALKPYLKKGLREEIVLATKGGLRMLGDKLLRDASPRWLRQGVEQSSRNLGVDYIDLYQVHWRMDCSPGRSRNIRLSPPMTGAARARSSMVNSSSAIWQSWST
jgi:aryl-alcohol dehydrogenase-like predicted oxidoreductase